MSGWDTACPDWEDRILSGRPLVPDFPLLKVEPFKSQAEKALRIFKRLRIPDVVGTPKMEDACDEWVFAIVAAMFGSFDPTIQRRMIQELFLLIPKKNGKSSTAAAIMVTAAIMNERNLAEFLLIAPTKKIADIAFKQASGIIALDPELLKIFLIQRHVRTITHRNTGATILIQAADTDVITGSKSTGILVDETHEFASKPRAAEVFVEIRGALAARTDGFMVQITTQSKSPPAGVFKKELSIARKVRDGLIKLPLLAVLYELPVRLTDKDGWKDQKLWPLVNPNFNRSVDPVFLQNQLITAEQTGPDAMALLASQHFNVQIGMALSGDRWSAVDHWQACTASKLSLDAIMHLSDVVVVGVDGGGLDDLLGLCVMGRHRHTREWLIWIHAWVHESVLKLRQEIAPRLQDFVRDGDLTIVKNMGDDVEEVADIIVKIRDAGLLPEEKGIGVDQAGVSDIVDELERRKITVESGAIVGVKQGWTLSKAIKATERRIVGGSVSHAKQPLMDWAIGNAKAELKGNATLITKQTAGTAKIDPVIAMFNAAELMILNPEASGPTRARALVM